MIYRNFHNTMLIDNQNKILHIMILTVVALISRVKCFIKGSFNNVSQI